MTIQAIETRYAGHHFRSRLEAGTSREYANIHHAARKAIAAACEQCEAKPVQAALRHDVDPDRLRVDPDTGCAYSIEAADYHALCIPCHRRLDLVEGRPYCASGHEYTPENTSIRTDGARRCLTCHRDQERARTNDPEVRARKNARDREYRQTNPMTETQKARKLELQRQRRAAARAARFEHGEAGR